MRYTVVLAALLFMLLAPGTAKAADGIVLLNTGLRAGPTKDYPLLANLHRGDRVQVLGCLRGWKWCEVSMGPWHGFVKAHRIGTDYYGRNVQVGIWGPKLGLPYVVFVERPYWEQYYRDKPFYHQRYDMATQRNLQCYHDGHPGNCGVIVHEEHTVVEHRPGYAGYNGEEDWHRKTYDHRSDSNVLWTNEVHNDSNWRVNN